MKCKDCNSCKKGWIKSLPEEYVCIGVKEPFLISNINTECTEYPELRVAEITNMTFEQTKEQFLLALNSNAYLNMCTTSDMKNAIEALDKQISKKPIYSDYDDNGFDKIIPYKAICPVCGHEFKFGYWNEYDNHHCVCGQALDWEEVVT